jgi:general secretion pathway protein A
MYQRFFGLNADPFGVSPDPRFFYASSQHVEASAALYYAIAERRGFAALIAPPGLGKTSVVVNLLGRLRDHADVVFLVHPKLDGDTLLESVLNGLGVDPDGDPARRTRQLATHLSALDSSGRTCVVILDEAQNLGVEALETVRMLSNFEVPGRKLIQFIFVGQASLAALLKRPECEQVRQRINVIARLEPLRSTDTAAYIAHRLRVAGAEQSPFTPAAVRAISAASAGVPRIINTLCFTALTLAFGAGAPRVTEGLIDEAAADLSLETVVPAASASQPTVLSTPAIPSPAFAVAASGPGIVRTPALAAIVTIAIGIAGFALWSTLSATGRRAGLSTPLPQYITRGIAS